MKHEKSRTAVCLTALIVALIPIVVGSASAQSQIVEVQASQSTQEDSKTTDLQRSSLRDKVVESNSGVPVHLNHVYVVLDKDTFEQVRKSRFVSEQFARTDSGMPNFNDVTNSDQRIYVRGQHTYLELLGPDNPFGEPVGKTGIALSVESPGAIDHIERVQRRLDSGVARTLQKWNAQTPQPVNWFTVVFPKQSDESPLVWWVSEYHADFLPALYPDRSPKETGILREQFLAPHYDSRKLFRDVHELTLRLPQEEADRMTKGLVAIGFDKRNDETCRILESRDLLIRIHSSVDEKPAQLPLVSLRFQANADLVDDFAPVRVGSMSIQLDKNGTGTWEFDHRGQDRIRRHPKAVPMESCFPIEGLSDESQELSKKLLLDALDSEALFTIVGDLKPISEGFFDTWFQVEPADPSELSKVRRAMSAWQCGNYYETGVLPFQHLRDGERFASGWIASRPALERKLNEHTDYFGRLGITSELSAEAILLRIEGAHNAAERWRGFGLVFGYPQQAVDFFVRAGMHYKTTGEFVERDFRNYPTHARSTGNFVYAVPKLEEESEAEKLLRRKVEAILTTYRSLRRKYIVDDKPVRVVELIRDWFDDGTGYCHPDHAVQKAMAWYEAREWVENQAIQLKTVLPTEPLDDLKQLDPVLNDRRIIALGESTHGTREFFQLKHRMFRHLVENHGVRLFGIEASYAACLPIDEYVQTGIGDPRAAVKGQGFWTWDTEEVLALVEWMREWNRDRPADTEPVRFYGFDTQDAYTPLKLVLDHLQGKVPEEASKFRERLSIAVEEQYGPSLRSATRDQLQSLLGTIAELESVCERQSELSPVDVDKTRLLLQQASSAININLSELEQWSSIGKVREIELYSRIRAKLPKLDSEIASLAGKSSASLMEFVRAAADLKRCQIRFRDELNEEQRQAWRDAVLWGREKAQTKEVEELLRDLQQFLDVSTEYLAKPNELSNARDKSMASFVTAILDMHGDRSRIALWAHDWHISNFDGNPMQDMPRLGTYLSREYGDRYLSVGLSFGTGGFQSKYYPEGDEDPAKMVLREFKVNGSRHDSFSHLFDHNIAPVSAYLLSDLIKQEPPGWFDEPHGYRTIGAAYQPKLENSDSYYEQMVLADHFDLVLHVRRTERARPLSPAPRFRFGAQVENDAGPSFEGEAASEDNPDGVLVRSVSSGSLAERCGLQAGDRIIRFAEKAVTTPERFNQILAEVDRPGSQEVTVLRENPSTIGAGAVQELTLYLTVPPWVAE